MTCFDQVAPAKSGPTAESTSPLIGGRTTMRSSLELTSVMPSITVLNRGALAAPRFSFLAHPPHTVIGTIDDGAG